MDLWTGLACVKPNPEVKNFHPFDDAKGAWLNVVAWVESKDAFEERVKRHAEGLNYILVELDNVQLLEARMGRENYPEELINMRNTAMLQQEGSIWGTFHTWEQDEAN